MGNRLRFFIAPTAAFAVGAACRVHVVPEGAHAGRPAAAKLGYEGGVRAREPPTDFEVGPRYRFVLREGCRSVSCCDGVSSCLFRLFLVMSTRLCHQCRLDRLKGGQCLVLVGEKSVEFVSYICVYINPTQPEPLPVYVVLRFYSSS